jgi:capsular polysaccharide transport system permease protein
MTNISSSSSNKKLAFDPNQGRQSVDVFVKDVSERVRTMSTSRPFVLFVIAAALVVGTYYFLLAAPIYVSETNVSVRGREDPPAAGSLLGALSGAAGATTATDIAELQNFITSYQMAEKLDQRFHLREIYSRPRLDFLNWLPPHASREAFLLFFKKMVIIRVDHDSELITIQTHAFDPVTAQKINQAVIEIASDYINTMSDVVRQDTLRTSQHDLQEAENDVRKARLDMTNYRASTGMLDPQAAAIGTASGMAAMQQEILQDRATIAQMLSFNRADSPTVRQLQARVDGLQQQIDSESKRISNIKAGDNITQRLREFEGLAIESDYADKKLVSALAAYDAARGLADQRQRFIVPVVAPNLPEEAALPHRMIAFLETMLVLIAVYGIVALAIAGIRDHQGI